MSYWFFLSYAHADQDEFLGKFYQDLAKEVRALTGAAAPESGFIDRKDIEHGAIWDKTLEQALGSCRVFVPIYSASYFLSEYCGKEFEAFRRRLPTGQEPLILPVLLTAEKTVLPRIPGSISSIQYGHGTYPPEYLVEGLIQLIRLGVSSSAKYYNQYWSFVSTFAATLVNAANTHPLNPASSIPAWDLISGVFSPATRVSSTGTGDGPRYVQFVFVVGKDLELKAGLRQNVAYYGPQGATDWKPYLSLLQDRASTLAIQAVSDIAKDMNYEELPLSTTFIADIQKASQQNRIVVVVVDTWTLRLEQYDRLVKPLDQYLSDSVITLVLSNEDDIEAATHQAALQTIVDSTFRLKKRVKDPNFLESVGSAMFKPQLIGAITRAQNRIMENAKLDERKAFALVNSNQNGGFSTKPSL